MRTSKTSRQNLFWNSLSVALYAVLAFSAAPVSAQTCEKLSNLKLPNTTITLAQAIPAGVFTPPTGTSQPKNLPAFCRVAATIRPTTDSDIKIEVWLPVSGWNGKLLSVGNGGWSGAIFYGALGDSILRGYAAASTDTGHSGNGSDASFALGHPEKVVDFGYRAVHEMTVQSKAIIAAFYGNNPKYAYWNGCSSGGKQGLKEAQRFPDDYDGIIAGAPANNWTNLMLSHMWSAHATLKQQASYIPKEKYKLINDAVLAACDALDGVKDGVLEDPTKCAFDPKALQCKEADSPTCLTASQVDAARKIYGPARNPRTGQIIFPGPVLGSELGWQTRAGGPNPSGIADNHFKYIVFKNPSWDWRTLDFDKDTALTNKLDNDTINATDPDLNKFASRGGKLIVYHGWNDQSIAPQNSINYYNSVSRVMGAKKTDTFFRLFMAPGMAHCSGGSGPNTFDSLSALEQWVEHGKAPEQITAAHSTDGKIDRTRPLCPYPQVAKYKGSGSTDDAANFICTTEKRNPKQRKK